VSRAVFRQKTPRAPRAFGPLKQSGLASCRRFTHLKQEHTGVGRGKIELSSGISLVRMV